MIEFPFPSVLRGLPSPHGVDPEKCGLGAWSDHVPFAFDLMAALRPPLFVELGTFSGESYFAFCQAAREAHTGTRAYAVDTWEGDEHTGALDRSAFRDVSAHNEARFASFSQLLRTTFDAARPQFADGSVDLLHIDGLHTYEAVRHDFEHWRTAVRPGGVVLFHDTAARHEDFGVWRLWEELSRETPGRAFEFRHGYGLGVLRLEGPEPSSPFLRALFGADERTTLAFREYYEHAAAELRQRKTQPTAPPESNDRRGELAVPETRPAVGLQVFFPAPGPYDELRAYGEERSLIVQFPPGRWRRVVVPLPEEYTGAPLRLDPVDCFGLVDVAGIRVTSRVLAGPALWVCRTRADLERLAVRGTARVVDNPRCLSLFSPGLDPVLLLPALDLAAQGAAGEPLQLEVWLRARATWEDLAVPVTDWLGSHQQRPALERSQQGLERALAAAATEKDAALAAATFERDAALVAVRAEGAETIKSLRGELAGARTERLLATTELNVCRRHLEQARAHLDAETQARRAVESRAAAEHQLRLQREAEVDATRVHARNLQAVSDNLRRQLEREREVQAGEIERARGEAAAEATRTREEVAERRRRDAQAFDDAAIATVARADAATTAERSEAEAKLARLHGQLATVSGHLAATEAAYRAELARRRAMQRSRLWRLGAPWRAFTKQRLDGETESH